jgi:hypothetical protein
LRAAASHRRYGIAGRWYAPNTREPIRDETIRSGLVLTGAVIERAGLPTTSAKPRYALRRDFAALFEEGEPEASAKKKMGRWQKKSLSPAALARIRLMQAAVVASERGDVLVKFPNGETRRMAAGPSSIISKAVIEEFTPRLLKAPGVVFLSESGNKVVARDDQLARSSGLNIDPERNLPDIILVDLGPKSPLLVFVEVVATDGAVTQPRMEALLGIAVTAGFDAKHVAFLSAFSDRRTSAYRKLASELAWGSFAWFSSEPDAIVLFRKSGPKKARYLFDLL